VELDNEGVIEPDNDPPQKVSAMILVVSYIDDM
jgi:hypothetical protein